MMMMQSTAVADDSICTSRWMAYNYYTESRYKVQHITSVKQS
jgi:hypothetical protein